jgi:hypothetical protein
MLYLALPPTVTYLSCTQSMSEETNTASRIFLTLTTCLAVTLLKPCRNGPSQIRCNGVQTPSIKKPAVLELLRKKARQYNVHLLVIGQYSYVIRHECTCVCVYVSLMSGLSLNCNKVISVKRTNELTPRSSLT